LLHINYKFLIKGVVRLEIKPNLNKSVFAAVLYTRLIEIYKSTELFDYYSNESIISDNRFLKFSL